MSESVDIGKLTRAQRDTLGQIAMDCDLGHHPHVLQALLAKGLIEEHIEESRDRLGVFQVKRYSTPPWVHIAWCEWCSQHCTREDGS